MHSAFAWVNSIFQTLGQLIPRLVLIRITYRGLLFRRDGSVLVLEPGLSWYWPICSELRKIPATTRTLNTGQIAVSTRTTKWNDIEIPISVYISGMIQISMVDPVKMVTVFDLRMTILSLAEMTMRKLWPDSVSLGDYEERVYKELVRLVEPFGINIDVFGLVDHYSCLMFSPKSENNHVQWSQSDRDDISEIRPNP